MNSILKVSLVHSAFTVFQALDKCQLGDLVRAKDEKLNSSGWPCQFEIDYIKFKIWYTWLF